jgi:hypothetical protein
VETAYAQFSASLYSGQEDSVGDSFSEDQRRLWKPSHADWRPVANGAKHCKTILACQASLAIDERFET